MECPQEASADPQDEESRAGVRLVVLNLPEDEGDGLGFRLTRTLWDPYPWVREVTAGSRASAAGLRAGDCLLQADGQDLLGLPISEVAGLIRGDGRGRGVSLLCWSCGVDPHDDPELLWSTGGGARGERARRALGGVLRALACAVCAATAPAATRPALACARSHLYCESCWSRLERCALCREPLPRRDSPHARNLVAEQVFEAIANEYDLKNPQRVRTSSARSPARSPQSPARSPLGSPARSPLGSPAAARRGRYQPSLLRARAAARCCSDPNIRQSCAREPRASAASCCCARDKATVTDAVPTTPVPTISVQPAEQRGPGCPSVPLHLHLTRLSHSLNNIHLDESKAGDQNHSNSMDNLKTSIGASCETPVFVLTAPPIYVVTCDHENT